MICLSCDRGLSPLPYENGVFYRAFTPHPQGPSTRSQGYARVSEGNRGNREVACDRVFATPAGAIISDKIKANLHKSRKDAR